MRELQNLNQINNDLPQVPIEDIIKDPEQYALDYYETIFTRHLGRFLLAYRLGLEFAGKNKGVEKKGKDRYYLDGEEIDKNLPAKYQYGTMLDEKPKLCKNCKFYLKTKTGEEYCSQWDAEIRREYWCKKWQKNQ